MIVQKLPFVLDHLSIPQLIAFARNCESRPLRSYARVKANALRAREAGNISSALMYESALAALRQDILSAKS